MIFLSLRTLPPRSSDRSGARFPYPSAIEIGADVGQLLNLLSQANRFPFSLAF